MAQPSLWRSRARGLLLAFPFVIGARRVVTLDSETGRFGKDVSTGAALVDLLRWIVLHVGSELLARLATVAISQFANRPAPATREPDSHGVAVYLRTDLDLAVTPLSAGGSAAHTEGIIRALRRRYTVDFRSTGEIAGLPADLPSGRLPAIVRANVPMEIAELLSGLLQGLCGPSSDQRPALIYQRYSLNNLAGLIMARRSGAPLILEANASEACWRRDWSGLTHGALADACERMILTRADRVVTVSRNAARGLLAAGAAADRLRVVPNGVEVDRFSEAEPMPLPFPPASFVICFSGLFYPWHGIRYLAEAFVLLREQRPEARLLLVGDGEEMPLARAVLTSGGALGDAMLTGLVSREQVPRYLAASDVLVSPHAPNEHFVGSPIKIFEYLAAGKAMVVSDVAQMGEMLTDGANALLTPPGDAPALAKRLELLCDEPELRIELGRNAFEEARRWHSWDARMDLVLAPSEAR